MSRERRCGSALARWTNKRLDQMLSSRRSPLLLLASILLGTVPVAFGLIRAISTGDDFRYIWLAAAAIFGSLAVMALGAGASGPRRVSPWRALAAVAAGTACAAATAIVLGARAGPGVAIVATAFGLCTGTSAVLGTLARQPRPS